MAVDYIGRPFIKGNTYLTLCRSSRKRWNIAMLQYIMAQAFLYVTCIAEVSVIVSCSNGYVGNMWSSPTYELAMDTTLNINEKYHISFSWINVLENMTVPQAFMITFAFLLLYLVALGILLYVCNASAERNLRDTDRIWHTVIRILITTGGIR